MTMFSRKQLFFFSCLLIVLSSCTSEFVDINRPGNKLSPDELKRDNYATGSFLIQMQGVAFPEQENAYQTMIDVVGNYLGRYTTYTKELPKIHTLFNASNVWCAWPASYAPQIISAFNEVVNLNGKESVPYVWALILRTQAFLRFTDTYGPFPLSLTSDKSDVYISQRDIYLQLIKDLNAATDYLSSATNVAKGKNALSSYDLVYNGDFNKWRRFASSLKLRIAIRISNVEPVIARSLAEQAVREGVIEENEDNCLIRHHRSGLWTTAVSWGDSRICADIESFMTGYKDPRISKYFLQPLTEGKRKYIGCRAGASIGSNVVAKRLYSTVNVSENTHGTWLTASEMAFCKAEGVLRGWNMGKGSAKEFYEQGVTLSFNQWKAEGAAAYLMDDTSIEANYFDALGGFGGTAIRVSKITIKWEDSAPMAEKMERLITQKWIALFPNGQEAWNEIRRTGYPHIFAVPQATNRYKLLTPNRIPFDKNQQINNRNNYDKAVDLLGGPDDYTTPMWWQK